MSMKETAVEGRLEVLNSLQHGIGRTLRLANALADDPSVGGEARSLLSRLVAIQAEIDVIASFSHRPRVADNDPDWSIVTPLWQ